MIIQAIIIALLAYNLGLLIYAALLKDENERLREEAYEGKSQEWPDQQKRST